MKENGDLNFYAKNKTVFNTYIEMFERFGREKNKETSKSFKKCSKIYIFCCIFYFEINRYHDEFYWIKTHLLIKKLFSRHMGLSQYQESVPHIRPDPKVTEWVWKN
jgi:hypothetical protein